MSRLFLFFILMTFFVQCHKEEFVDNKKTIPIKGELTTFVFDEKNKDWILYPEEMMQRAILINTDAELKKYFSAMFFLVYPEYEKIEWEKYSLIITTSVLSQQPKKRTVFITLDDLRICLFVEYDQAYLLENIDYVELFGVLIPKVSSKSEVQVIYQINSD